MTRLFDWFVHESGCRSGNLFLERAPLFDTALETQAAVRALEQQILDFADTGGSVVLTTHHSLEHLSQVRQLDLGRVA